MKKGEFFVKRDWLAQPPKHLTAWTSSYVGYGIFRTPHQLQIYDCMMDYEAAMERIYRGMPLDAGDKMHPFTITADSDMSELKEVAYGNDIVSYFILRPTNGIAKLLKIVSTNHQVRRVDCAIPSLLA